MSLTRPLAALGGALLLALAGTAAANAATAYASSTVNVRSGPGTGYSVLDALDEGDEVDVQYCKGAWCFVEKPGPDGWVNANYLTQDEPSYRDDDEDDDDDNFYFVPRHPRPHYYKPYQHYPYNYGEACVGSHKASFCIY